MKSLTAAGGSFMGLCSKIKTITFAVVLMVFAVSCGESGGDAPGCAGGGELVGGFCWYRGVLADDCDDTCLDHGGYNEATRTYAGSDGTDAHCEEVLDAIGIPAGVLTVSGGCGAELGCMYDSSTRVRCSGPTTTSSGFGGTSERMCACNE